MSWKWEYSGSQEPWDSGWVKLLHFSLLSLVTENQQRDYKHTLDASETTMMWPSSYTPRANILRGKKGWKEDIFISQHALLSFFGVNRAPISLWEKPSISDLPSSCSLSENGHTPTLLHKWVRELGQADRSISIPLNTRTDSGRETRL